MPNPPVVESRPAEITNAAQSGTTASASPPVVSPGTASDAELAGHTSAVDPATLAALVIAATGLWLHRIARRYG